MAKDIYVSTGEISSRTLRKCIKHIDTAQSKLSKITGTPTYQSPDGWTALYSSDLMAELNALKTKIADISTKLDNYASILGTGPEEYAQIDRSYKSDLTSWWERASYSYSTSYFGKATATIGGLAVDVCQDVSAGVSEVAAVLKEDISYGTNTVAAKAEQIYSDLKASYDEHGALYDVVEYGKCAVSGTMAVAEIVTGAVEVATGAGIPMGVISIISGIDTLCNVAADATYISCDCYEMVGKTHWLEDKLVDSGNQIGTYMGNPEAGELIGEATYLGFKGVSLLGSADSMLKDYGNINTHLTGSSGYSDCWGWTSYDDAMDMTTLESIWKGVKSTAGSFGDAQEFGEALTSAVSGR